MNDEGDEWKWNKRSGVWAAVILTNIIEDNYEVFLCARNMSYTYYYYKPNVGWLQRPSHKNAVCWVHGSMKYEIMKNWVYV